MKHTSTARRKSKVKSQKEYSVRVLLIWNGETVRSSPTRERLAPRGLLP
jgi:hypothetical protein